ncbi:MAG: S8/S53 family peptidase [Holophagales bacterium]|jgi:hypothetical protein|nr:S8/S53 family peptidase [Holophagales bacterium]
MKLLVSQQNFMCASYKVKAMKKFAFLFVPMFMVLSNPLTGQSQIDFRDKIAKALKSGKLLWQFSNPDEVINILGKPLDQETKISGGLEILTYQYSSDFAIEFHRYIDFSDRHFALSVYTADGNRTGISLGEFLQPRNLDDIRKIDPFYGLSNVNLSKIDLRSSKDILLTCKFSTSTIWPPKRRLPKDFDPHNILNTAKNPGLGISKLHTLGLDGRDVDIAIIDQPILSTHYEYKDNLKMIVDLTDGSYPPQMHASLVVSIAVGKTCGVAPNANVYYFSVPFEETNLGFIQAIRNVMELNERGIANIKVISISTGRFELWSQFIEFQHIVSLAESKGILLLTCAKSFSNITNPPMSNLGIIRPRLIDKLESPSDFEIGSYSDGTETLLIPSDCRTYASHINNDIYIYSARGGRSNAPPWLAGLVAIGFQVNPHLSVGEIKTKLLDTAWKMPYGTVVNPIAFINSCKT